MLTFQSLGWSDHNSGEQHSLTFCLALEHFLRVGSKPTLISLLFIGTTNFHLEEYGKVAKSSAMLLGLGQWFCFSLAVGFCISYLTFSCPCILIQTKDIFAILLLHHLELIV